MFTAENIKKALENQALIQTKAMSVREFFALLAEIKNL